jgi:hypothetical protein
MTTTVKNAGYLLQSISAATNVRAIGDGVVVPGNPWMTYHQCDGWELAKGLHDFSEDSPIWPPVPDWSTWDGESRVFELLNAIDPESTWYPTSGDRSIMGYAARKATTLAGNNNYFQCIVPDWLLPWVSGQAADAAGRRRMTPPVWPGLDKVTFFSTLPFYNGYTIAEPMDGLTIEIDVVPPTMGHYSFAAVLSYIHAGMVTFADDNGQYERAQPFTFEQHVIVPHSMARAYRAIIKCHPALTGTVRTWTIDGSNIPNPFA